MSIFSTSIRVGIGLVLGWGLTCLGYRLTRSQAWGEASSRLNKSSLTPGPQSRDREHNGLAPVRVVTQGQAGWARRRQERVKAVIGEETYRTLEALMCWCWGAEVEEVIGEVAVGRSGFYYRLEQALARLPRVFGDGRQHNGRQVAAMDNTVVGRIVEMVIGQPGITPEEVSQRLAQQDGSRVKAEEVADYLAQARLADYHGSPYRQAVLPVVKEAEDRFSRYAAHLLQVPALEQLGFYQVAPLLDVTGAQTYYSHLVRCHTVFLTLSSGKTRLYHTGELVEDEFARTLGEARYPQSSDLHAYFDRIVERDQAQAEQGVPEEERLVGRFVRQAQQVLARTIQPGAGRAIYLDPHVIALYTAKPIARTKHGIQQRVVKALVKLRVVSANQPGRPLAFLLGQGDLSEYETIRRADGCKVRRLKTRVADVPDMLINSQGYRCRTIVVEDVRSRHRIGIHAVGQPTRPLSACQILAFLRGKQWVEEDIKQGIAWGSDAFCGGEILPALRRARPNAEQVQALKAQARKLKERWQENLAEEGAAVAEWRAGQRTKRQLNDLLKGIRRRRRRIAADWQQAENLIRWGQTGVVPPSQVQWVVDTRKMLLMSQFQDFARLARQETMTLLQRFLKQAVIESAIVEQDGAVSIERQQSIEREAERMLERMPWGQLETRLFEQGGWVHKDSQQGVIHVTVKPFKNRLLQRACELLCEHLNRRQSLMRCQDGEYTLHYACRASPPP
jgi:hypothetical protein